jgi:FAD synthase
LSVETHLLEHAAATPPAILELQFLHRPRDEQKFPSIEELKSQIVKGIQRAARFFGLLEKLQRK